MKLRICGEFPEEVTFIIKAGNQTEKMYCFTKYLDFEVLEKGECMVEIQQEKTKTNKIISFAIFFLTLPIQGVFNIFLMNTNSKWYENIKAYCVKAKINIILQESAEIHFVYLTKQHDYKKDLWELPELLIYSTASTDITYEPNFNDFGNQYFKYVKKMISITSILFLILLLLLYFSWADGSIVAKIVIATLIAIFLTLITILILREYVRLKAVRRSFFENIKRFTG